MTNYLQFLLENMLFLSERCGLFLSCPLVNEREKPQASSFKICNVEEFELLKNEVHIQASNLQLYVLIQSTADDENQIVMFQLG